jgi:oxygen-dependent protoporphyrinogen oxidase
MPSVIIVGAGISGLALAYRLQQLSPPLDVLLLELGNRPGGTIWTERLNGFQVEIGPNGFLDTKPSTLALCRELDLGPRLIPASDAAARNRYLFQGGKLRALPGSLGGFLRSDLLSFRGKLAFFLERFRKPRQKATDESIAAFARRRAGREAAEIFADALVTGIFAGDPALLSLRATFPRLAELEARYGSVLIGLAESARQRRTEAAARGETYRRGTQMWSFPEGLRILIESLHARLVRPLLLGVNVQSVRREPSSGPVPSWRVAGQGKDSWTADVVVLTCPAYQQAALLTELDEELAKEVGRIPYNRVAVIALGYRREEVHRGLDGFGYIAPQGTRRDVLGVQWCSSIFPERAPPGLVLLRALAGGWHRADVAGWDDDRLLAAVRDELRLAMGIQAAPLFHHIIRWDRAIPQYHLGHLDRVAWVENRLALHPGLFLAGNAYRGVAMNDCTEQAEILANRIWEYLNRVTR